jgi:hypothetical protein
MIKKMNPYLFRKILKDSGKELYAFLFNDTLLMIEASEALQNEMFKKRMSGGGKFHQMQIYKHVRKNNCLSLFLKLKKNYFFERTFSLADFVR